MRRNLAILAVVLLGLVLSIGFEKPAAPPSPGDTPASRITQSADRSVFATGIVEGAQQEVELRSEVESVLLAIEVAEGARVTKGQSLARFDGSTWERELSVAQANQRLKEAERKRLENGARRESRDVVRASVRLAEVRLAHASREKRRAENLSSSRSVSSEELDRHLFEFESAEADLGVAKARRDELEAPAREDELHIAEAEIALARATVEKWGTLLGKAVLRAPSNGRVLQVIAQPGEIVGPREPRPILVMVDDSITRVRAFVEELDVCRVSEGQHVSITADGLEGRRIPGTVVECIPYIVPKTVLSNAPGERVDVKVREVIIHVEDPDKVLLIGMPVDVTWDSPATTRAVPRPTE